MTTTPRRPADIAALTERLRRFAVAWRATWIDGEVQADDLDAAADLLARWPTADEIADMRAGVARVGELASVLPTAWQKNELRTIRANLAAFLDRLDPPEPQPQADDDVDPWALLAALVGPCPSVLEHVAAVRAARAALDARRQS